MLSNGDIFLPDYLKKSKQQSTALSIYEEIETDVTSGSSSTSNALISLNFSSGISAICLSDIVRHKQLQEARERIQNDKKDDEDVTSKLKAAKKLTAGICWKNGTNRLGKVYLRLQEISN